MYILTELKIFVTNLKSEEIINFYIVLFVHFKLFLIRNAMFCFDFFSFPVSRYLIGGILY